MKDDLLLKYITGKVSQAENEQIGLWLQADAHNKERLTRLRRLYQSALWQTDSQAELSPKPSASHSWRKILWNSAAVIALLFASYTLIQPRFFMTPLPQEMLAVNAPAGERTQISLPDGTIVWLNARSTLTFPNAFNKEQRTVCLQGEAYFQVKSNKKHPFIVQTPERKVKVYGTEFNVISLANYFETALVEGSVSIDDANLKQEIVLTPGTKVYTQDNGELKKETLSNYDHFLWKEGILYVEDATFSQLASKLEQYYGVEIILKKEFNPDFTYDGKFRVNDGVEHVLQVLQLRTPFHYTIEEDGKNILIH